MIDYREEGFLIHVKSSSIVSEKEYDFISAKLEYALKRWEKIFILQDIRELKGAEVKVYLKEMKFIFMKYTKLNRKLKKYALVTNKKIKCFFVLNYFFRTKIENFTGINKAKSWLSQ